MKALLIAAALAALAGSAGAAQFQSQYTDVDTSKCKVIEETGDGFAVRCKGYGGVIVTIAEGDLRDFVSYGPNAGKEKAAEQTLPVPSWVMTSTWPSVVSAAPSGAAVNQRRIVATGTHLPPTCLSRHSIFGPR